MKISAEERIRSQIDFTRIQLDSQVRSHLWDLVWRQVDTQLWDQINTQAMNQVYSQVWDQVRVQVMGQTNQLVKQHNDNI